jgi:hypothetical protein
LWWTRRHGVGKLIITPYLAVATFFVQKSYFFPDFSVIPEKKKYFGREEVVFRQE